MKNIKLNFFITFFVVIMLQSLIGCGTKVSTGAVNVQFQNATANSFMADLKNLKLFKFMDVNTLTTSLLGVTPTIYQMKLVAIYLVENIDSNSNNVGNVTRIWTSEKCDNDLTLCGIGPAAGQYIVDYFDFAVGTAQVNATLASYRRDTAESTINTGTYRYIRIDFTGSTGGQIDTTVANLKFGTSSANEVRAQVQAISVQLPSPLVLAEGENFTVDLAYNLENRFYSSAAYQPQPSEVSSSQKWTCNGTVGSVPCVVEAEFVPTVTKN